MTYNQYNVFDGTLNLTQLSPDRTPRSDFVSIILDTAQGLHPEPLWRPIRKVRPLSHSSTTTCLMLWPLPLPPQYFSQSSHTRMNEYYNGIP